MAKKVLVTGGAGFIGRALTRSLLARGHSVVILDNFSPQVHETDSLPSDIAGSVELVRGDVRDEACLRHAVRGANCIVHLAAETGTGQSMYRIGQYFDVNVNATALLLDVLQDVDLSRYLETLVVASSRAVYGEGAYTCPLHGLVTPSPRTAARMQMGQFDPQCRHCDNVLKLVPTTEDAPFSPMSFYGLTKQVQEQAVLLFAQTRQLNGFALRYQNVYGPGQSLHNPYTGILAVFSNLARQAQDIEIYEDGRESRDFVFIDDVAEVTARCVDFAGRFVGPINVGSGIGTDVLTVAHSIAAFFQSQARITVSGAFRVGDIRHNIADLTHLKNTLSFVPDTVFGNGVAAFLAWAETQQAHDKAAYGRSVDELVEHGLLIKPADKQR